MKPKLFGLDIGTTSIKVASIKNVAGVLTLESIAVAPSSARGIVSESLIDLQTLADVIKQMLTSANIKTNRVALSIPESQVYTRVIEMPELSDQELTAALKFEMEQYIPLPLDKVKTDWQVLGRSDNEGQKTMDVMLVAAPLQTLQKYEKVMEMIGLTAEVIETEIISVHRSLFPLIDKVEPNILVHIGATTTGIAIVKSGTIKMVVSVAAGGLAISRAIAVDLGIDVAQADSYKKAYGLNKDAFEGKIGRALSPILESIIGDIRKATLLFKEKNNSESIKQIILSGGTALLPGIDAYFTNALGTQLVLGSAFSANNIGNVPNELQIEGPSYNVVVGLAVRNITS